MKKIVPIIFFLFLITGFVTAQGTRTLTGLVTNSEDDSPLEGVTVFIKGSTAVSGTQADGIYYLKVNPSDSVVVFQLSGFEKKEVKIVTGSEINIELKPLPPAAWMAEEKHRRLK